MTKNKPINFEYIKLYMEERPDEFFPPDEVERRFNETLRRIGSQKPTFNLKTGQPIDGPQFSVEELKRRGY